MTMDDLLIYRNDSSGVTATLTTDSTASSYGVPVLRLEGHPAVEDLPDLGPADDLPSGITAAELVVAIFLDDLPEDDAGEIPAFTEEGRDVARRFLAQDPLGPQLVD